MTRARWSRVAGLAAISVTSLTGWAQTVIAPSDLKWIEDPARPGIHSATLAGDPFKPGLYTRRIRLAPRTTLQPHWHPEERSVTTLSGTWYVGYGPVFDPARATKMVPGTFLVQPGKVVHFEFTIDEEAVVQVSGIGPTATEYVK